MLQPSSYFSSVLYTIEKPELLSGALNASNDALDKIEKTTEMHDVYQNIMSGSLIGDPRVSELENFIANAGWSILDNQGYNMDNFMTFLSEFWAQKHHKFSGMEQHVHPHGVALSGFYFLECPEGGCMAEFHDPRPGKVQSSLPYKDLSIIREANNSVFVVPKPGMLLITNSWLPHSFTRNTSDVPVKFIHFNISVMAAKERAPIVV